MTQTEQEDYEELKQNVFDFLQMLPYVKDNKEEYDFIQRRLQFNISRMLFIKKNEKK